MTSPVAESDRSTADPLAALLEPPPGRHGALRVLSTMLWPAVAFAAALAAWYAAIAIFGSNPLLLPSPGSVAEAGVDGRDTLLGALGTTLLESALGFAISIVAGLGLAILIVSVSWIGRVLLPALTLLNAAPKVVVAPILIIWLGIGISSKVALAFLLSFFPIVINCIRGLSDINPELLEFWHLMRAKERQVLYQVRLPNCLPYLYDGCLIALPMAIVGAVIGEFVASDGGIGHVIILAYSAFDTAMVFAATILISIVSTILFLMLQASEPLMIRWRPRRGQRVETPGM
jgi:NitT/TauT family transport system permease protein